MSGTRARCLSLSLLLATMVGSGACAPRGRGALMIERQGSFAVGGTVVTSPGVFDPKAQPAPRQPPSSAGQTLHGDHAYVFYQVPVQARRLPLVMWHGIGQFSKTWETTPDGREGYQNIFLRRRFPVYVVDQPRLRTSRRGLPPSGSASGRTSSLASSSHPTRTL